MTFNGTATSVNAEKWIKNRFLDFTLKVRKRATFHGFFEKFL